MPDGNAERVKALFSCWMTVPEDMTGEVQEWLGTEVLPKRRQLPGVISGELFSATDGSGEYVVLHELDSVDALESPEFTGREQELDTSPTAKSITSRLTEYETGKFWLRNSLIVGPMRGIEANLLMTVRAYAKPGKEHEQVVREWLDEEHSVMKLACPGAHSFQSFEPVSPPPFYFFNLWGLEGPEVVQTEQWNAARLTPWRARAEESRGNPRSRLQFYTRVPI